MGTRLLTLHDIISITDNGSGKARVTAAAAHNLAASGLVGLSGTNGYDGSNIAFGTVSATVFDLTVTAFAATSAGGTWVDQS